MRTFLILGFVAALGCTACGDDGGSDSATDSATGDSATGDSATGDSATGDTGGGDTMATIACADACAYAATICPAMVPDVARCTTVDCDPAEQPLLQCILAATVLFIEDVEHVHLEVPRDRRDRPVRKATREGVERMVEEAHEGLEQA